MNTFQLECFLAVSNTLSFVRAAEQLNISQPAITHQIKTLEDELNTVLFKRSTRFVEITQEGISFIGDAKKLSLSLYKLRCVTNHLRIFLLTHHQLDVPI